jgi:uncharacterized protein YndB with AHSA1/START domain
MKISIDRTGSAVITLPSDNQIRIERKFDATAEMVFDVWTTEEHIRNWWGYPEHEMTECTIDLRVGGAYRFAAEVPGVGEIAFHGINKEIDRPHRLVSTEIYEAAPDAEAWNTLTLEEADGVTTLVIVSTYPSKEVRDTVIESGMESGLQVSLDRAETILTDLKSESGGPR